MDGKTGQNQYFSYDALDRLTDVSGAYTAHYAYDALGNLEVKTEGGTSHTMQYTDPAHVHAASVVNSKNYRYDANGNLLSGGGRTLAWDAENRLVAATVAEYE